MPPKRTAECSLPIADCNRRGSPNPDALLRCYEHSVGGLDFKGVVTRHRCFERDQSREIDAGNVGRLRPAFDVIVGDFSAPGLRPSEKDALIARITIEHRRRLSFERSAIGVEREREAA